MNNVYFITTSRKTVGASLDIENAKKYIKKHKLNNPHIISVPIVDDYINTHIYKVKIDEVKEMETICEIVDDSISEIGSHGWVNKELYGKYYRAVLIARNKRDAISKAKKLMERECGEATEE